MDQKDLENAQAYAVIGIAGMTHVAASGACGIISDPDGVRESIHRECSRGMEILSFSNAKLTASLTSKVRRLLAQGYASRGNVPEFDVQGIKTTSQVEAIAIILQKAIFIPSLWLEAVWDLSDRKEVLIVNKKWSKGEHEYFLSQVPAVSEIIYWNNISKEFDKLLNVSPSACELFHNVKDKTLWQSITSLMLERGDVFSDLNLQTILGNLRREAAYYLNQNLHTETSLILSEDDFVILEVLSQSNYALAQEDISARANLDRKSVGRRLRLLKENGLVGHPIGKKNQSLGITKIGRTFLQQSVSEYR